LDLVTQIVLGAAVGEVVLGKKAGNKAIMWGAIGGLIPDLDVRIRYINKPYLILSKYRQPLYEFSRDFVALINLLI